MQPNQGQTSNPPDAVPHVEWRDGVRAIEPPAVYWEAGKDVRDIPDMRFQVEQGVGSLVLLHGMVFDEEKLAKLSPDQIPQSTSLYERGKGWRVVVGDRIKAGDGVEYTVSGIQVRTDPLDRPSGPITPLPGANPFDRAREAIIENRIQRRNA